MLDEQDTGRLNRLLDFLTALSDPQVVATVVPDRAGSAALAELARSVQVDHAAVLVFADSPGCAGALLSEAGWQVQDPIASVVVADRLSRRYALSPGALEVSIVRAFMPPGRASGRSIEVFSVGRRSAETLAPRMIARERRRGTETHLALRVSAADDQQVGRVRELCQLELGFRPDGGGYNPYDGADTGGRSVLYFRLPAAAGHARPYDRLELTCAGRHAEVIAEHQRQTAAGGDDEAGDDGSGAARWLLSLLTGHWAARAVHAAAHLGVADALAGGPRSAAAVAARIGGHPEATGRLLRYLAQLGLVQEPENGQYANTAAGELLRDGDPFRDLVTLYGGEFYQAWDRLPDAVRGGTSAFGLVFGLEHFDYFGREPAVARRFDRAMAAVTSLVATAVSEAFDFPRGGTVVDVGGGNGTMLRAILRAHPTVSGIVFDRDHVAGTAVTDADRAAFGPRLTATAGDFLTGRPPGGAAHLLSRVLHDWDDQDCLRILRACRAAMTEDGYLLIAERMLPEHGAADSLAVPWDLQMLAITGGRERTQAEYARLLAAAGFRPAGLEPLSVDLSLLIARPEPAVAA
jgi:hypothetical protein